ncbi:MAG TPA: phospholipase domain-containing protein, partial [Acidiphilium sp.]
APPDGAGTLMPQETGQRRTRPLPYALTADFAATATGTALAMASHGKAGACFYVYRKSGEDLPWRYTIGPGDRLNVELPSDTGPLALHGPNGFYRAFNPGLSGLSVRAAPDGDTLNLTFHNATPKHADLRVADSAYGAALRTLTLAPGETATQSWNCAASDRWYDLIVTAGPAQWRLAGHIETGKPGLTDPAATAPVLE